MTDTIKEINKTPEILKTINTYKIDKSKKYLFVGCGSSYNIGLIISKAYNLHGIDAKVKTSGEILLTELKEKVDVAILITRTGTSTETVKAAEKLTKLGIHTVGITCSDNTPILKHTKENYAFEHAYEKSVVMTGSFIYILNFLLNGIKEKDIAQRSGEVLHESKKLIDKINTHQYNHFVFLGLSYNYGLSKEGALKMQEMALENIEFHESLEYRHGPKSTLTHESLVVVNTFNNDLEHKLIEEIKSFGAKVITIGKNMDIDINDEEGIEAPLRMIPLQYLAYKRAIDKGLNPDQPKNLDKSVIL